VVVLLEGVVSGLAILRSDFTWDFPCSARLWAYIASFSAVLSASHFSCAAILAASSWGFVCCNGLFILLDAGDNFFPEWRSAGLRFFATGRGIEALVFW